MYEVIGDQSCHHPHFSMSPIDVNDGLLKRHINLATGMIKKTRLVAHQSTMNSRETRSNTEYVYKLQAVSMNDS